MKRRTVCWCASAGASSKFPEHPRSSRLRDKCKFENAKSTLKTSDHTTPTIMSLLSGNLLIGTGIIHSAFGLALPELREPFLRGLRDGFSDKLEMNERYAREAGFWFEMFGILLIMQGFHMRSDAIDNLRKAPPKHIGWALTALGIGGVLVMPASGFWLIIPQGLYILVSNSKDKAQ